MKNAETSLPRQKYSQDWLRGMGEPLHVFKLGELLSYPRRRHARACTRPRAQKLYPSITPELL